MSTRVCLIADFQLPASIYHKAPQFFSVYPPITLAISPTSSLIASPRWFACNKQIGLPAILSRIQSHQSIWKSPDIRILSANEGENLKKLGLSLKLYLFLELKNCISHVQWGLDSGQEWNSCCNLRVCCPSILFDIPISIKYDFHREPTRKLPLTHTLLPCSTSPFPLV